MTYSRQQRQAYLDMIDGIGARWIAVFEGDRDFYSTAYWDLLTALWSAAAPLRKTDALAAIKGVRSAHTAGKYLAAATRHGLVEERCNPADARSKLVALSPEMQARLDAFLDDAVARVQETARALDGDARVEAGRGEAAPLVQGRAER